MSDLNPSRPEFNIPEVTQSSPLRAVFGRVRMTPMYIWAPKNQPGYGWGQGEFGLNLRWNWTIDKSPTSTEGGRAVRSYRGSAMLALCDGLDEVVGLYVDDDLVWSGTLESSGGNTIEARIGRPAERFGTSSGNDKIFFYFGNQTDLDIAAPFLTQLLRQNGVTYPFRTERDGKRDNALYKGTALVYLDDIFLGDNIQTYPAFDVLGARYAFPGVDFLPEKARIGDDANAAHIVYSLMIHYARIPPAFVDRDSFIAAANTIFDEGLGISIELDERRSLTDLLTEIEEHIDCKFFPNTRTGKIQMVMLRGDYTVSELPEVDRSMVSGVDFNSPGWESVRTQFKVRWTDPDIEYRETSATIVNPANEAILTQRKDDELALPFFTDRDAVDAQLARASIRMFAPLRAMRANTVRRIFDPQPGGLFRYSDSRLNVSGVVFRVVSTSRLSDADEEVQFSAVEDIFSIGSGFTPEVPGPGYTPVDLALDDPPAAVAVMDSRFDISGNDSAIVLAAPPATGTAAGASVFINGNPAGNVLELSPVAELVAPLDDSPMHSIGTVALNNASNGWVSRVYTDEQAVRCACICLIERPSPGPFDTAFELLAVKEVAVWTGGNVELRGVKRGLASDIVSHAAGARVWLVRFFGEFGNPPEVEPLRTIGETRVVSVEEYLGSEMSIQVAAFNSVRISPLTTAVLYQYAFRVERPTPVHSLVGELDGSDVILSWRPRSRVPRFFMPGQGTLFGGALAISEAVVPAGEFGENDGNYFITDVNGDVLLTTTEFQNVRLVGVGPGLYAVQSQVGGFFGEAATINVT